MTMRRSTLFMVCVVTMYTFTHRMSVVPFYDLFMRKFSITYAEAGGLLSAFFIGYALLMVPCGILADRLGAKKVLVTGLAVVGLASTAFALSESYVLSLAMRFLIGVGIAMVYPSTIKILAAGFSRQMLGFAMGLRESAVGAGILTAVTVFPLLARRFEPLHLFLTIGLLWLPIAAGFIWLLPSGGAAGASAQSYRGFRADVLLQRSAILLAGVSFFALFAINGFIGWFPTYLEKVLALEKGAAGMVMAANTVAMIVVSLFSGRISDLVGRRPVIALGSIGLSCVLVSLLLGAGIPLAVLSALAGASAALSMAPMMALAVDIAGVDSAGAVAGLVTAVGQMASAIAGSFLGWLVDLSGTFSMSWAAMLVSLTLEFALVFCIRERRSESAVSTDS